MALCRLFPNPNLSSPLLDDSSIQTTLAHFGGSNISLHVDHENLVKFGKPNTFSFICRLIHAFTLSSLGYPLPKFRSYSTFFSANFQFSVTVSRVHFATILAADTTG